MCQGFLVPVALHENLRERQPGFRVPRLQSETGHESGLRLLVAAMLRQQSSAVEVNQRLVRKLGSRAVENRQSGAGIAVAAMTLSLEESLVWRLRGNKCYEKRDTGRQEARGRGGRPGLDLSTWQHAGCRAAATAACLSPVA